MKFYRDVKANLYQQHPIIKDSKTHQTVADVFGGGSMEEAESIANLFASSPELLAACKMAEYCLDSNNSEIVSSEDIARTLVKIRLAIAGAES